MTLTNLTDMPGGGYGYREPAIGFEVKLYSELALTGLQRVAQALQQARANNPASGLDPSYEACLEAIKQWTCARFAQSPKALARFCGGPDVTQAVQTHDASRPLPRGCASCGRRR